MFDDLTECKLSGLESTDYTVQVPKGSINILNLSDKIEDCVYKYGHAKYSNAVMYQSYLQFLIKMLLLLSFLC